jgi:Zn-dependent protease/predicted transcriptional regulator
MFGKRIRLFKLLGFAVNIDLSWLVLALLITWSLARGLFPYQYEHLPRLAYWFMGAAGAVGLFGSIIFHELCHSLVARRFGMPMKGITLFIFGGVAEMDEEPPGPKAEFLMAIAGPASSALVGALGFMIAALAAEWLPTPILGVIEYLTLINFVLMAFNLLPAFPLDGGRVLRAALWQWKKNFRWATRIASRLGSFFGAFLVILGILNILRGNAIGGIWQSMIGLFLGKAAKSSYDQAMLSSALEGETVRKFMNTEPVVAPAGILLKDLVERYVYRYHFKMFPVVEGGTLVGCITTRMIKEVPQEAWGARTVGDAAGRCSQENSISPDTPAVKALGLMGRTGNTRLMVVEHGALAGIVTLKDIMSLIATKRYLEENDQEQVRKVK